MPNKPASQKILKGIMYREQEESPFHSWEHRRQYITREQQVNRDRMGRNQSCPIHKITKFLILIGEEEGKCQQLSQPVHQVTEPQ